MKAVQDTVLFAAICIMFVFAIGGCSKDSGPAGGTISFWHFYSEPSQKQALQQLVQDFEKVNNCKVNLTELSWNDGKTKLLAAFNSQTAPDVVEFGSDWVAQFSAGGVLKELDTKQMQMEKFLDWSLAPCRWDGKLYTVPWIVDTRVLYVNNSILEKAGVNTPPATMDDVMSIAEMTNEGDVNGFGVNGPDGHKLYKRVLPFFWSSGGSILDSSNRCVIASPANVAALTRYVELSRVGYINTQKILDAQFAQGKLAMWYSGGWLAEKISKENPLLDYSVVALPDFGANKGVSFAGGEYLAITKQSANADLAAKFIAYLTDGKNALALCRQIPTGGFPADKKYFNDNFFASHPIRSVFARQLESARMTPIHPKWLEMELIIENAAEEALYGRKTPEQALGDAQYLITKVLATK
ncbi:MAG: extracellular solute-binding protein [Candidatus Kapabacteria bacterium]|nr:extracellular solute-binding protein [Candidatus Kapabacteria bacterium]